MVKRIEDSFTELPTAAMRYYARKKASGTCYNCHEKVEEGRTRCRGCLDKGNKPSG